MAFLLRETTIYLIMKYFECVALQLQIKSLLALFIFESFTQELAFHLSVVFQ